MNLLKVFQQGKEGKNMGLSTGFSKLDKAIGGVKRGRVYSVGAESKVGKTTFVDFSFVINAWLDYLEKVKENPNLDLQFIYFSYEIKRIFKEFDFAAHFFYRDYKLSSFKHKGKNYNISGTYLMGELIDHEDKLIVVKEEHEKILLSIYKDRIIPLFGEYSLEGKQIKKGIIIFLAQRDNPTGMRNFILSYAQEHGKFIKQTFTNNGKSFEKIIGYKPKNPEKFTIVVTDHVRKLKSERGYTLKQTVDKWSEYTCELRDWCDFSFVHICHINRSIGSIERIKFESETLHPTADDFKDTGNLGEDSDYVITMFDPTVEKYKLKSHFGLELGAYPDYRSVHLVNARNAPCPQHLQLQMYGHIKYFEEI